MPRGKKRGTGRRYGTSEKKRILKIARKQKLTGAQVRKRFGVSTLTFYRWRGPVRGRRGKTAGTGIGNGLVQDQVRETVRRIMPGIIRREVAAYLDRILQ